MMRVTLYSKPGCHLCDDAKAVIDRVRTRIGIDQFELEIRNILLDPADFANYQFAIPVVLIDGIEIARYRLSEEQFADAVAFRAS